MGVPASEIQTNTIMNNTFKFFQKLVPHQLELQFPQPRYPRFPTRQVPAIEGYDTPELRGIFLAGWRACEHGREIFDNPYSTREELIYLLHRAWERGWLECYHNHPSRERHQGAAYGFEVGINNTRVNLNYIGDSDDMSILSMIDELKIRYAPYVSINQQIMGFMEDFLNEHLPGISIITIA